MIDLTSHYQMHLDWMYDNQPHLVRELLKKDELATHLDNKMQVALEQLEKLMAAGKSNHEAWEMVERRSLSPGDSPSASEEPPEPVSDIAARMLDPQKTIEREALLKRHREIQAELAQIERNIRESEARLPIEEQLGLNLRRLVKAQLPSLLKKA